MTLNEHPAIRDLPVLEKLELVDEIWQSVAKDLDTVAVSADEKRILDERWESFLKSPESALTTGEFMERLAARRA